MKLALSTLLLVPVTCLGQPSFVTPTESRVVPVREMHREDFILPEMIACGIRWSNSIREGTSRVLTYDIQVAALGLPQEKRGTTFAMASLRINNLNRDGMVESHVDAKLADFYFFVEGDSRTYRVESEDDLGPPDDAGGKDDAGPPHYAGDEVDTNDAAAATAPWLALKEGKPILAYLRFDRSDLRLGEVTVAFRLTAEKMSNDGRAELQDCFRQLGEKMLPSVEAPE